MRPSDGELELALGAMADGYGELLARVSEELQRDASVGALFVVGSAARGAADDYSDLDLLLVAHGAQATLAEDLPEILRRAIPAVMARWTMPGALMSIVTPAWLRLDAFVADAGTVGGRRLGPALRVFDDIGIEDIPERTDARAPEDLRDRVECFLRGIGLLARDLHRGDLRLLCFAVEFLVDDLVTLMFHEIDKPRGPQKGACRQLPRECVELLDRLPVAHPEPQSIIDAHMAVAAAYLPRARALASRRGVEWPKDMEVATRRYLARELALELP